MIRYRNLTGTKIYQQANSSNVTSSQSVKYTEMFENIVQCWGHTNCFLAAFSWATFKALICHLNKHEPLLGFSLLVPLNNREKQIVGDRWPGVYSLRHLN